jgi:RNA polymerase sigma factor (sigma-70 family)
VTTEPTNALGTEGSFGEGALVCQFARFGRRRRHPPPPADRLLSSMAIAVLNFMTRLDADRGTDALLATDQQRVVLELFHQEARALVRLARVFVDNRDAAEDIVQEAFIRLARNLHRIEDREKAPAYLRSIVLNLARDINRRGLMSLRHAPPAGREVDLQPGSIDDRIVRNERQQQVLEAVRSLPRRQRDCIALRYFEERSIDEIAATLDVSVNSVKTHLQRALASLERLLERDS